MGYVRQAFRSVRDPFQDHPDPRFFWYSDQNRGPGQASQVENKTEKFIQRRLL